MKANFPSLNKYNNYKKITAEQLIANLEPRKSGKKSALWSGGGGGGNLGHQGSRVGILRNMPDPRQKFENIVRDEMRSY